MTDEEMTKGDLGGAHGSLEGGEAMIEGAEDGDHAVGDGLALLERLLEESRPLHQRLDCPHCRRSTSLSFERWYF